MDIRIRTAVDGDAPAITEIYNQAVALRSATADTESVTVESRMAWLAAHAPDRYPVWVAEQEGLVVGWCSLSPHRSGRMALRHTAEISYYIHEDYRRRGIGSRLIDHALEQCQSLGFKSLFAILLDVNTASIGMLEKFGFEKWGHLPSIAEIDGKECGQFIYGRRVVPSLKEFNVHWDA
jgi:L-amino acid N-acyltransferase YncA